jgi:hypothetical protein
MCAQLAGFDFWIAEVGLVDSIEIFGIIGMRN